MNIASSWSIRNRVVLAAVLGTMGFSGIGRADCFYFRSDSYAEPYVVKHVSQGRTETVRKVFSRDSYARDISLGWDPERRKYFYRHKMWVGADDYYVAWMRSDDFAPKIVVQTDQGILSESVFFRGEGYDKTSVHFSGRQVHRNGEGDVFIIFTSDRERESGSFVAEITQIRYRYDIDDDWPNEKWIPLQAYLNQQGACEQDEKPVYPVRPDDHPAGGGNTQDCPSSDPSVPGYGGFMRQDCR